MPKYVVRIVGRLSPRLSIDYADFTEKLPSFSVTIEKGTVKVVPHTNLQLEPSAAQKRLQHEILPLLTVLGTLEGRAISLEVTDVIYIHVGQAVRRATGRMGLIEAPPTTDQIHLKVQWATVDSVYRDLLDFYTEAIAAPNPRPAGYKMVERLEKKFGNRKNACSALGINDLKPIVANQSLYQGDRHAEYNIGDIPARLSQVERSEVLKLLKHIICEYENRICALLQ